MMSGSTSNPFRRDKRPAGTEVAKPGLPNDRLPAGNSLPLLKVEGTASGGPKTFVCLIRLSAGIYSFELHHQTCTNRFSASTDLPRHTGFLCLFA